ncbi:MAG: GIY-YIG nuclease family protein [Bacteroidia bacterium]|nr:GIY-YIG nuclease family protein [Bacteroidia bacterium]
MSKFKILYVYILKCSDDSYYTGITNNMELRLLQHETGINPEAYTFSRRPVELVFIEMFNNYNLAIEWEKKIKKWSRNKKEALINSNWEKLKEFSKCRNHTKAIPMDIPWPKEEV